MIENISQYLLKYFIKFNVNEKFVIYEIKDLLNEFKNLSLGKDKLLEIIKTLELKGFIIIKYLDKEKICLSVLPFARQYLQTEEDNFEYLTKVKRENFKFFWLIVLFSFIGAFIGSLLGRLF